MLSDPDALSLGMISGNRHSHRPGSVSKVSQPSISTPGEVFEGNDPASMYERKPIENVPFVALPMHTSMRLKPPSLT